MLRHGVHGMSSGDEPPHAPSKKLPAGHDERHAAHSTVSAYVLPWHRVVRRLPGGHSERQSLQGMSELDEALQPPPR